MTTFDAPFPLRFPTRQELRQMLNRPSVLITAILAVLVAFVMVVGGVVFLVATDKPTEALTAFVSGIMLSVLAGLTKTVSSLRNEVRQNGARSDG